MRLSHLNKHRNNIHVHLRFGSLSTVISKAEFLGALYILIGHMAEGLRHLLDDDIVFAVFVQNHFYHANYKHTLQTAVFGHCF